ncbi:hypothetical protein Sjap_010581 [Stephania japonica]|uniref:Uncharacterized protein n=1 Tax=Stephania japonica TaxID=461633 RepID=A0AAP0J9N3_9MAGN
MEKAEISSIHLEAYGRETLFLFSCSSLFADILGRMIDTAKRLGHILKVNIGSNGTNVTHLQFAEDSLLIMQNDSFFPF